ncbi:MAG: VCBS repeat-containing protein [Roseobacter sp.]
MLRGIAAVLIWLTAVPLCAQVITSATYTEPTTRYPHGVLGDDEEWGNMSITVRRPKQGGSGSEDISYDLRLPEEFVFEDIAPRLVDLDGVEGPEIVGVQSHQDDGARLVIYGLDAQGIPALRAYTAFIGTRNRWLAPIGVADFDGDGVKDIAIIVMPHLAKTAYVMRYTEGLLSTYAEMRGLTNHRIGDDYISGGVRDCGDGPEMILLNSDWSQIVQVKWIDGLFQWRGKALYRGRKSVEDAMKCG